MAGWMDKIIAKTALNKAEPDLAQRLEGLTEPQIVETLKSEIEAHPAEFKMVVGTLKKFSEKEQEELLEDYPNSRKVLALAVKHNLI